MLNTLVYDVEFPYDAAKKYTVNVIVVNLLSQCDPDGFYTNVMEVILDYKRDGRAVPISEKYFTTKQGKRKIGQSTLGWSFQIKWENGSTEWAAMKYLKETNPVDVVKYSTARGIKKDTAFTW